MTDTNKVIQSLWIGDSLSVMEQLCIQSFLRNGHEFHLYVYQDIRNVPINTTLSDANGIIPFDEIFVDSRGGIASFSDWFRYKLLYEKGGWWVDTDSICLKFFDIEAEYCFSTEGNDENDTIVNNGFIKSPANAQFLADALEYIDACDRNSVQWGEFGPVLLGSIIENYDSQAFILPPEAFCPVYWSDVHKLISEQDFFPTERSFALHLWNEIWRRKDLDKNAVYHPDSIYEQLKRRYEVML